MKPSLQSTLHIDNYDQGILFFGKERRASLTKGKKDRLITRHALHSLMIMLSSPLQRLAWLAEFQVPDSCLYQWNLDSGFQSLVAFRIPMPRIPDFTSKNFPDSGNPDSLIIKVGRKAVIMDTSQTLRCRC